jgi:hypothetical protein
LFGHHDICASTLSSGEIVVVGTPETVAASHHPYAQVAQHVLVLRFR